LIAAAPALLAASARLLAELEAGRDFAEFEAAKIELRAAIAATKG
jgi:hypothetical protein